MADTSKRRIEPPTPSAPTSKTSATTACAASARTRCGCLAQSSTEQVYKNLLVRTQTTGEKSLERWDLCLDIASKYLCGLGNAACHYIQVWPWNHSQPGRCLGPCPGPVPGFLTCLDGGLYAVFRLESHGLPSVTPQRMGRLQGFAEPTAASPGPSTLFFFLETGEERLVRRPGPREKQNKACCGTVSPRTELMQLDGAMLSVQTTYASALAPCCFPIA